MLTSRRLDIITQSKLANAYALNRILYTHSTQREREKHIERRKCLSIFFLLLCAYNETIGQISRWHITIESSRSSTVGTHSMAFIGGIGGRSSFVFILFGIATMNVSRVRHELSMRCICIQYIWPLCCIPLGRV